MPFTFSHPALILPLLRGRRRWVSATGLIAGSIAPDFEKFFFFRMGSEHSHTWPSLLYFSLPVGLGLGCVYHGLVRAPLVANLPLALQQRLAVFQNFNWWRQLRRHLPAVVGSLLIGAASHLLWDRFTHGSPLMLRYLPQLDQFVRLAPNYYLPLYTVLGSASSFIGSLLVIRALHALPRQTETLPLRTQRATYWPTMALGTAALVVGWATLSAPLRHVWDAAVAVLSCGLGGVLLASGLHRRPWRA